MLKKLWNNVWVKRAVPFVLLVIALVLALSFCGEDPELVLDTPVVTTEAPATTTTTVLEEIVEETTTTTVPETTTTVETTTTTVPSDSLPDTP